MPPIAEHIHSNNSLSIYHSGPPLSQGPLPSLFYFALSGKDSIELDPYNQPVAYLKEDAVRVFSFTLPGHGTDLKNSEALKYWADGFARGENPVSRFIEEALENVDFLIRSNYADPKQMAAAGLSRGAFMAAHFAAKEARISHLLGFAPLTRLDKVLEFKDLDVGRFNLENLIPDLIQKKVRFYIGNLDKRVHTEDCFNLIHKMAEEANAKRVRNLNFELNIVPSIGHQGHGTSPETFLNGINWLKANMGIL